ncbi:hypothetical protein EVAR_553_1 [Eumeta japonica]|uniref:DDE Tnp4 domain-containing protein n=1 Tax=Eumeta variegata TaxID=151549 RepID=A0A4C1SD28_EUMVA|nr:hypothetical protein EVAR_553_1 [Eumeta japonica]
MKKILSIENKDIFILDRGFRDVVEKMSEFGFKTYTPLTKGVDQRQLIARQADGSRKVTCRRVVETANGRVKNRLDRRGSGVSTAAPRLKRHPERCARAGANRYRSAHSGARAGCLTEKISFERIEYRLARFLARFDDTAELTC